MSDLGEFLTLVCDEPSNAHLSEAGHDEAKLGDLVFHRHGVTADAAGKVTTKSPRLETKDELKRRIDEAARYAPLEQLALSPQCG